MTVQADDFLRAVQARTARVSASASATRNQGRGVTQSARLALAQLCLDAFGSATESEFRASLNRATKEVQSNLPMGAASWGLARKLTNIFLRDALYTKYLADHYHLARAEPFMEIPLDSITSWRLRKAAGRGKLPRWIGVKHLTPSDNKKYQEYGRKYAADVGVHGVHLDTYWWGRMEELGQQ